MGNAPVFIHGVFYPFSSLGSPTLGNVTFTLPITQKTVYNSKMGNWPRPRRTEREGPVHPFWARRLSPLNPYGCTQYYWGRTVPEVNAGRRVTGVHLVGGWVGWKSSVGNLEKRNIRIGVFLWNPNFIYILLHKPSVDEVEDLVTAHKFTTCILIVSSNLHKILLSCCFLNYCTFVIFQWEWNSS